MSDLCSISGLGFRVSGGVTCTRRRLLNATSLRFSARASSTFVLYTDSSRGRRPLIASWWSHTALTHVQSPAARPEALRATSSEKSGCSRYG